MDPLAHIGRDIQSVYISSFLYIYTYVYMLNVYVQNIYIYMYTDRVTPHDPPTFLLTVNLQYFPLVFAISESDTDMDSADLDLGPFICGAQ